MNTSAQAKTAKAAYLLKVFLASLAVIAVFIVVDLAFIADGRSFKREGGGLETASAVLYFAVIYAFFRHVPARLWASLFQIPGLMALFAMREFDMDKAFTQSGIMSIKFYSGDSSLVAKLIGGAVAVLALYILYRVVRFGAPAAWRGIRGGESWPWFAALAGVIVVATKSIDGLGRKMLDFGIVISEDLDLLASSAEEIGEAFIPVCALLAVLARWKGRSE